MSIPVIAVIGPTAVGKTALSVELAKKIGGEVISVDSRQVYRYMDVGTDKIDPRHKERRFASCDRRGRSRRDILGCRFRRAGQQSCKKDNRKGKGPDLRRCELPFTITPCSTDL